MKRLYGQLEKIFPLHWNSAAGVLHFSPRDFLCIHCGAFHTRITNGDLLFAIFQEENLPRT